MNKVGTYKGKNVYEVTRDEYIQKAYYESESTYYAISDDTVNFHGHPWKKFIYQNRIKGLLNEGNNILEDNIGNKNEIYYVRKPKMEQKTVELPKNSFIDVDEFLRSAHSVDEYLKEMAKVKYEIDC